MHSPQIAWAVCAICLVAAFSTLKAQPWSAPPTIIPEVDRPRVAIIVIGLMRTFESTWPILHDAIVVPNKASFRFEVHVATDLNTTCSNKDWRMGCCVEPLESSAYHFAALPPNELLRRIRATYAPYLRSVISSVSESQAERLRTLLSSVDIAEYVHILLTRPDVVPVALSRPIPSIPSVSPRDIHESARHSKVRAATLQLSSLCTRQRAGLDLITGSFLHGHNGFAFHRDHDWMAVACKPAALLSFFFLTVPGQTACATDGACPILSSSASNHCMGLHAPCASPTPRPPAIPAGLHTSGVRQTTCGPGREAWLCAPLAQSWRDHLGQLGTLEEAGIFAAKLHAPNLKRCPPVNLSSACAYTDLRRQPAVCEEMTAAEILARPRAQ